MFKRLSLSFLALLIGIFAYSQTTPVPIPVTGNLTAISGQPGAYNAVVINLNGCSAPVSIYGYSVIVQDQYLLQANSAGIVNGTVWPNDLIDCNGTTGQSSYSVQYLSNGTPVGTAQCYQVTSAQGNWNLQSQQPITCTTPPPNPQDATYRNLVVTNSLTTPVNQTFNSITASVNTQLNVMAANFGAKGDCATDDHGAIQAAFTAALTYSPPAAIYFPKPPGGCYLTSTLTWSGQSLLGQPSIGNVPAVGSAGVVITGQPGEDVLYVPDPSNVSTAAPAHSWAIQNITIQNNDSIDASANFPHRWPGRWFNDAGMTSGSAVLTTTHGTISCGDVGQNIQVNGAGASGGNLTTTIASVSPCSGHQARTITLAASASTTVSNAAAYITPMGISLTRHIGNCAIAADDRDGNPSDWTMTGSPGFNADTLRDVAISSTSGTSNGQNNSCGIYTQGVWGMYNLDARNTLVARETWGIVQGCPETNSYYQSCSNDFQLWDHASWNLEQYPWISYNGGQGTFKAIEITANNGPQILGLGNMWGDGVYGWNLEVPEFEQAGSGAGNYGFRIEGAQNSIHNTNLAPLSTQTVYIDSLETTCDQCGSAGPLQINGYQDTLKFNNVLPPSITDNGVGNQATAAYDSSPYQSQDNTRFSAQNITRGPVPAGVQSADFVRTGNVNNPYFNDLDMFIWPDDIAIGGPSTYTVADSTSLTGKYYPFGNFGTVSHFQNLKLNNGRATNSQNQLLISNSPAGGNVPATNVIVYASLKCLVGSTATIAAYANSTSVNSGSGSCNSSTYSTISVTANLSSYSGQALGIQLSGSGNFQVAWLAVRPFQADFNGLPLTGSGVAIPTGPSTTLNGDLPNYFGTTGQLQDSGKYIAGAGAVVPSGPASSTAGDLTKYNTANGDQADSGIAASSVPLKSSTTPTVNAGVCWKTTTTLGTCTAGTWPNCTTCN